MNDELLEHRDHVVYQYGEMQRIIQFYGDRIDSRPDPSEWIHSGVKSSPSLIRARSRILELALCNKWDFFVTLTISDQRDDLDGWYKRFRTYIRNQQQKGRYLDFRYLLIPERHKDGNWHCHGFLKGIPFDKLISFAERLFRGEDVPVSLANSGFYDWPDYSSRFGYCSLGTIRDSIASAFYITKYITKSPDRNVSQLGRKLYYCSLGLERRETLVEFRGRDRLVDALLTPNDFCASGWIHPENGLTWADYLQMDDPAIEYPQLSGVNCPESDYDLSGYLEEMEQLNFWNGSTP